MNFSGMMTYKILQLNALHRQSRYGPPVLIHLWQIYYL